MFILTKMNNNLLELFYNEPSKHWHFEELLQKAKLSRPQVAHWLRKYVGEELIQRHKPRGKMPYYVANYQHPHYQNSKRLQALTTLHESGLLDHLASLEKAETVILFGSFSRWDWYSGSDIDIFVYGDVGPIPTGKFSSLLRREIQVFAGKDESDLKKMGAPFLQNILKGITIKGTLPQEVITYAAG